MKTAYPSIQLEIDMGLAIVTLSQPERGNPFDGDFTRDMKEVFMALWDCGRKPVFYGR